MPLEFGFVLTTPSPGTSPSGGSSTDATTPKGQPTFLGVGVLRPFRRDGKNDFANGGGLALIKAMIGQVLGTKAQGGGMPGEIPWRTTFGSRMHLLRHRNASASNDELARLYATEALAKWIPRVRVIDVAIVNTGESNTQAIAVRFDVLDKTGRAIAVDQETTVPIRNEG